MATAAGRQNGDLWILKIGETGQGLIELGYASGTTINASQDLIDTANKNSGRYAEHVRGDRSFTIDFEGFSDFGASDANLYSIDELYDALLNGTDLVARFTTDVTGDWYIYGDCDVSSLTMDAPHNGAVTFSGTLQVTGALTKAVN